MRIFFYIGILSILILSCNKERKCIKSLGETVTEIRMPGGFSQIEMYDKVDLVLEPAAVNEVLVTSGQNMVPFIITEVKNGVLTIRDENSCNFLRSYKKYKPRVTVRFTDLKKIYLESAGHVTCTDTLRMSSLEIEGESASSDVDLWFNSDSVKISMHTGTSNFTLSGTTYLLELYSGGNGIFHLENLRSEVALTNNSGTGNFYVYTRQYLFAVLNLLGNTYYRGNPSIDADENGEGKLLPLQ